MSLKREADELRNDWATQKAMEILPSYEDDRAQHLKSCDSMHAIAMEIVPIPPNGEEHFFPNGNVDANFIVTCDHTVRKTLTVEMGMAQLVSELALLATVKRLLTPEGIGKWTSRS